MYFLGVYNNIQVCFSHYIYNNMATLHEKSKMSEKW